MLVWSVLLLAGICCLHHFVLTGQCQLLHLNPSAPLIPDYQLESSFAGSCSCKSEVDVFPGLIVLGKALWLVTDIIQVTVVIAELQVMLVVELQIAKQREYHYH